MRFQTNCHVFMRLPEFKNINLFPEGLENSPDVYFSLLMRPFFRRKLKMMVDLLPATQRRGRALEIGYGCGIALKELSCRFDRVVAIDIHKHRSQVEEMLEFESIENVTLHRHDIFREPFQNGGAFDYVFSSSVMEHIDVDGLRQGVRHIHAITAPGGFLLLGFPVKASITDLMFMIHENTYMKIRSMYAPVSTFSNKTSHISGHDEITAALAGYFEIEAEHYINRLLKVYMVLKCRRVDRLQD